MADSFRSRSWKENKTFVQDVERCHFEVTSISLVSISLGISMEVLGKTEVTRKDPTTDVGSPKGLWS